MEKRIFSVQAPKALEALSDKWRETVSKQRDKNGMYVDEGCCCVLCGKKAFGAPEYVLLSDTSRYVTKEELTDNDLGMFPVGSDCAKKLKKAGIPVYTRA